MTFEGEPERGISDVAINNRKYIALLAYYRLDNYSNSKIKEAIFLHFTKSVMESKDRIPDSIVKELSASTKAISDEKSREFEERVVALWRVHWYRITLCLSPPPHKIEEILVINIFHFFNYFFLKRFK